MPPKLTPNTVLDGGIRRQLASSLGSQQRMDELRNTLTEWQYQPGQNWFEDEDDDDEIQYDNSTFQSDTNEIKEMIRAMEFSVNEKFTDLDNKICNLTDRIGTIEEWQDKMSAELVERGELLLNYR